MIKLYTYFIDVFKAFDRVNHFKLFKILAKTYNPKVIVSMIICCYVNQKVRVRGGSNYSECFNKKWCQARGHIIPNVI